MMIAQGVGTAVGVGLMAAPALFGYAGSGASDLHRAVGPLAASAAVIAIWPATRGVRLVNFLLGVVLLGAPLVMQHSPEAALTGALSGSAIAASAPFGGRVQQSMGGGWRSLIRDDPVAGGAERGLGSGGAG